MYPGPGRIFYSRPLQVLALQPKSILQDLLFWVCEQHFGGISCEIFCPEKTSKYTGSTDRPKCVILSGEGILDVGDSKMCADNVGVSVERLKTVKSVAL